MRPDNASPHGVTARSASANRIRKLSTAVVLATVFSVGASQGTLDSSPLDQAHRIAHDASAKLPAKASMMEAPPVIAAGIDIGTLTAAVAPSLPSAVTDIIPDPIASMTDEALHFPLPRHLAYTPPSPRRLAREVANHPDEIIHRFVLSGQASLVRHNARADLRRIRESIREMAALEGNPDDILEFEEMKVARWIVDAVRQASVATGVDAVYMMALADKESSLIPDISARTSSAEGLFQFIEQTWLEVVGTFGAAHGLEAEAEAISVDKANGRRSVADAKERERILNLRRDPLIAGIMAGEMMKRDRTRIETALERELTWHELYMAHFLGAGGAIRLLKLADTSPKKAASKEFPAAARANRTLFFAGKGRGSALSVEQVYALIETMIAPRLERYASLNEGPSFNQLARTRTGPLPVRLRAGS